MQLFIPQLQPPLLPISVFVHSHALLIPSSFLPQAYFDVLHLCVSSLRISPATLIVLLSIDPVISESTLPQPFSSLIILENYLQRLRHHAISL